ncbi:serine O-acetyltransferase [Acetobacter aceti NRIC 0242]|uniref:Serine acetyltransferase n=1 Tax=Acetobacter aceti NBRC 14818 TaxID=887700 RepID=A0AB33I9U7_ACEAC|nr:serine O-acetyltransferase [Acetobacter aceti]TCS32535.1 serine O-acetyltransferase [Acetobacter aceti NBRC 14818]BCK75058.1 serine acetyltransferase [Acetobacter aceti NBRC 14818]GAN57014.1 serine O-acetyltransferase [Acetobacter aceti NBRC 14818]GBO80762.1 serine O-acetyltransferase [Acetobacter aceti NRIC 0242]
MTYSDTAEAPINLNSLWKQMVQESQVCCDPLVMGLLSTGIKNHSSFATALAALIGRKLGDHYVSIEQLTSLVLECYGDTPDTIVAGAADLQAIRDRDPACPDYVTPFLFFKGFHAVQCYRVAHWLWNGNRRHLAQHLQSRASELFAVDIHPAAKLGRRILFDHGTGIVVGETSIIENDVSLLQGVTLGGTGKHAGDRHPRIRRGVLIGAGAKVLGAIEVGEGAKVGAGSIVLEAVPPYTTVVGNPARKVGTRLKEMPSLTMDQTLPPIDYII